MHQFTIRQLPEPVENRLREFAQRTGQSLNKAAISLLGKALGVHGNRPDRKRDVESVIGGWTKEQYEEFEANTRIFESIDEEVWK